MSIQVEIISRTCQRFDGKLYWLCGRYFQAKGKRLHRVIWETLHGTIPKDYHVHHVDGNAENNQPENLILLPAREHLSRHAGGSDRLLVNLYKLELARDKAARWHGSNDGINWHRENFRKNCAHTIRRNVKRTCRHCGTIFMAIYVHKSHAIFCSGKCKTAARKASGVDKIQRECAVCGNAFMVNKYEKTKCCSRSCGRKLAKPERGLNPD